ncbi:uncharacterized protein METZ01_LOCUS452524, partial [marine metagenome]
MKKLLLLLPLSISFLSASDWPRWLGPDGTGVSNETDWQANLEKVAWKAKV